ncbi:hypothetical protein D3C76_1846040 [compost metagenome]
MSSGLFQMVVTYTPALTHCSMMTRASAESFGSTLRIRLPSVLAIKARMSAMPFWLLPSVTSGEYGSFWLAA